MSDWHSGLFDCCSDCGICCYGCWCTPCLYGENAEKIDGSNCVASCCIWYLLTQCSLCCLVHMGKRAALRHRYGLREDCNDCLATTFCAGCAICQEARELKYRSAMAAGSPTIITQPTNVNVYSPYGQQGPIQSADEHPGMTKSGAF